MRFPYRFVVMAAVAGLLAGCAGTASTPRSAVSTEAGKTPDFEAMAAKLHSPRLMAQVLLKQAQDRHDAKRAVYAGLLALRANDTGLARRAADFAHDLAPTSAVPYEIKLRAALDDGDVDAARKEADGAFHRGGTGAVASMLQGPFDPWFSYAVIGALVQAHPGNADLTLVLARAALGAGDNAAALAAAREAAAAGADAETARFVEIQARWSLGRRRAALAEGAKVLSADPHDVGFRVFFAGLVARAGDAARAREILDDAGALAPDNPHVQLGYAVLDAAAGDDTAARARLTTMLEQGSDSAGAYHLLGRLAARRQAWGEAFGWFSAIDDADFLGSSGVAAVFALSQWKGLKSARAYLGHLQEAAPGLAPTWVGAEATLLDQDGENEAAFAFVSRAVQRYPVVRPLRYQRALLADKLGKVDVALDTLERLVAAEPENAEYLNAYGYTLTEHTHRYREAYGYIKRALAADPDNGAILDSMGWVLFRMDEPAKAVDYLRRAWVKSADIDVAEHLVEVYIALGRTEEAAKVLTAALAKAPDNAVLKQLKQRLKP